MATKSTKKAAPKSAVVTATFEFERSTKNTHRFHEDSETPVIGTLYVQQSAFPNGAPESITVTIS